MQSRACYSVRRSRTGSGQQRPHLTFDGVRGSGTIKLGVSRWLVPTKAVPTVYLSMCSLLRHHECVEITIYGDRNPDFADLGYRSAVLLNRVPTVGCAGRA